MTDEEMMEMVERVQGLMEDLNELFAETDCTIAEGINAMLSLIASIAKARPHAGIEYMVEHALMHIIEESEDYEETRH